MNPVRRDILPIPDVAHIGLTTYDAEDPDTSYPPISDVPPSGGRTHVVVILHRRRGLRSHGAPSGGRVTPSTPRSSPPAG